MTPSEQTLKECEDKLRLLGLSEEQLVDLGDTIDVIGDILLDKYFALYE